VLSAAVLIDFENVYFSLLNRGQRTPIESILQLIKSLRKQLLSRHGEQAISMDAYADFERLPSGAQGELYLLGVDAHNVLGTGHKNAADMKLCIDAMVMLYTNPGISTFVFVAGDRDYIFR
jgi:hypothetical protein